MAFYSLFIDKHRFSVHKFPNAVLAKLAAITTLLNSAERQSRIALYQFIYKDRAFVKLERKFFSFFNIFGKNGNAQTKF